MNAEKKSTIAERLCIALKRSEYNHSEFAEAVGLSKASVSNYLSGRYEPGKSKIPVLAEALGVSPIWLQGYDVPMNAPDYVTDNKQLDEVVVRINDDIEFRNLIGKLNSLNHEQLQLIDQVAAQFLKS